MRELAGGRSRRGMLREAAAAGAAGLAASVAGCGWFRESTATATPTRARYAPAASRGVAFVDLSVALDDRGVRALVDASLGDRWDRDGDSGRRAEESTSDWPGGGPPADFEAALDRVQAVTGLDPRRADWQFAFSGYAADGPVGDYVGTVFAGNWGERAVVEGLAAWYGDDRPVAYDRRDHAGRPLYVPDRAGVPFLGVAAGGVYVSGARAAVEDALAAVAGDGEPLDGPLRAAYEDTPAAPVRFAGEVAPWVVDALAPDGVRLDRSALADLERAAGIIYRDGDVRGTETTLYAPDEDAAREATELLKGYTAYVANAADVPPLYAAVADRMSLDQRGAAVVATSELTVADLMALIEDRTPTPG